MEEKNKIVLEIYKIEADILRFKIQKEFYQGKNKGKISEFIKNLEITKTRMTRLL